MSLTELAVAIFIANLVGGIIIVVWCNKKIKEFTDPDNWKK